MNYLLIITALLNVALLVILVLLALAFKKYKRAQKEQDVLRESFTAMVIHELRSPLSVIQGSSDLLIAEVQNLTKEQIFNTLNQIKTSSHNLLGIVNDLLDLAKLETGKITLVLKKNSINKLLTEEYNYYFEHANERGVNLIVDVDESVTEIPFDYEKIKRVLTNLISNALKYTDPGESIFLFSKRKDKRIEVSVADTGKGVPEDKQKLLFNKFMQVQASSHKKDNGTGLGLAIAKGIVKAYNGKISYEKNMPKGSKFIFTFPVES